jgi:hypothetical protein
MKTWEETTASQCRYSDIAEHIFKDAVIIWEDSSADYQGNVNIVGVFEGYNGKFFHFVYSYGSCSGCDEWEDRSLSDDEIETEMREKCLSTFENIEHFKNYVSNIKEMNDALTGWLSKS